MRGRAFIFGLAGAVLGLAASAQSVPVDWALALRIADVDIRSQGVSITGDDLAFLDAEGGEARLRLVLFDGARRFAAGLAGARPLTLRLEVRDLFGAKRVNRPIYAVELRYALAGPSGTVLAAGDWRQIERPVLAIGSAEESLADAVARDLAAWASGLGCVPGRDCAVVAEDAPKAAAPDPSAPEIAAPESPAPQAASRLAPEESARPRPRPADPAAVPALPAPPEPGATGEPALPARVLGFLSRLIAPDPAPVSPAPVSPAPDPVPEAIPETAPDATPSRSALPPPRRPDRTQPPQPGIARARWIGSTPAAPGPSDRAGIWIASDMVEAETKGWVADESTGRSVEVRLLPRAPGQAVRAEMSDGLMRALGLVPGQHANLSVYLPR